MSSRGKDDFTAWMGVIVDIGRALGALEGERRALDRQIAGL
jgi:hypothetical protein